MRISLCYTYTVLWLPSAVSIPCAFLRGVSESVQRARVGTVDKEKFNLHGLPGLGCHVEGSVPSVLWTWEKGDEGVGP